MHWEDPARVAADMAAFARDRAPWRSDEVLNAGGRAVAGPARGPRYPECRRARPRAVGAVKAR
jgi:hypothetical protein